MPLENRQLSLDSLKCITEIELLKLLRITRGTAWRIRKRRRDPLPYIRIGSKVLYPCKWVEAWLKRQQAPQVHHKKKTRA